MESLETAAGAGYMDDLLDFASDIDPTRLLPDLAEEDLEWISNKDSFPAVETFVDIISGAGGAAVAKHNSPVSVLETTTTSSNTGGGVFITSYCSGFRAPGKARSKCLRRRRRVIRAEQCWWSQDNFKTAVKKSAVAAMGRKCQHCGSEKTPQWRAGPMGPKTLCNACGVRFKSGRLVPEYRPASSPTFCNELHSNSHRKVLEMRKQKQMMGMLVVKPMEKG